jgi:hypothetical protein
MDEDNSYPPDFDEKQFFLEVSWALASCQMIEETLKQYISDAFDLVRKFVGHRMIFKFSGEQHADSSLERLIEAFSRLCDNDMLIKDLRKFKDKRNFLSHRGISHCLDPMEDLEYNTARQFLGELPALRSEGDNLRSRIHEESRKFLGHLYFEALPDPRHVPPTEIPSEWWSFCEMDTFRKVSEFYSYAPTSSEVHVVPLSEVEPPIRDAGAPELDKFRLVAILCAFKSYDGHLLLPPCKASHAPPGSMYRFELVDGYHRYYASNHAGFTQLPVVIVNTRN